MSRAKRVLQEGVLVALVGTALAFAANGVSPKGLKLTRNYFAATTSPPGTNSLPGLSKTNAPSAHERLVASLQAKGMHLADSNQVSQLFQDPRCAQDLVVFVDARDDQHYQGGHIPGAYQFFHYYPENYLTNVLPAVQMAQQIVVYCNGGDCDDSVQAATMLLGFGVPGDRMFVYEGGMMEWATNNLPIELGSRRSGNLRAATSPASTNAAPPK